MQVEPSRRTLFNFRFSGGTKPWARKSLRQNKNCKIMEMADSQRKFDAAVHVIRSLPKSGPFQPSGEMMLKFYGYYKQAKEGPCNQPKPSFWDVINKAKWEAWSKLGDTSKEEAMENYVHELKEVIGNMPETDQASQFITALEPFYKLAYKKEEKAPPIFNMFCKKTNSTPSNKMNGHVPRYVKENGPSEDPSLNTSHASAIHITGTAVTHNGQPNGDIRTRSLVNNGKANGVERDLSNKDVTNHGASNDVVLNGCSDVIELSDSNKESNGNNDSDDDDDDLFCDSLGPELLEEQVGQEKKLHSGTLESVPEDVVPLNDRNLSSFSDVEILEQFELKKNGGSGGETSSTHSEKMVHVHFEDLNTSQCEASTTPEEVLKDGGKECVVQPNQHGAGSGDTRGLMRATASDRKQTQRNVQYSERSPRYGQRYRRRSQESDSDESPGRSDHNSSSERDDAAYDRIADLLADIQDNMKRILERLKRLETSIQQSHTPWFENYRPSKTFVFLILWPIIVNFLFKFLRRRLFKKRYDS